MKDISEGDTVAFKMLHALHCRMVKKRVEDYNFTEQEAEDIVQEIFEALWETRNSLMKVANIGGYLNTMARNKCNEYYNKKKRREELHKDLLAMSGHMELDAQTIAATQEKLLQAIAQVSPPACRHIAYLIFFQNFSDEQVAAEMNTTLQYIRNQKSAGKKQLISFLKKII